jgi:hypothetical protein
MAFNIPLLPVNNPIVDGKSGRATQTFGQYLTALDRATRLGQDLAMFGMPGGIPVEHMCALLDPNAYSMHDIHTEPASTMTVPAGTTWYALNLYYCAINGSGKFFLRGASVETALALPAGTTITPADPGVVYAYLCRPETVTAPSDPIATLTNRLGLMHTMLPLYTLQAENTNALAIIGDIVTTDFPNDFTQGLIRFNGMQQMAWTGLAQNAAAVAMNFNEEISGTHEVRFTRLKCFPFNRSTFGTLVGAVSSYSGLNTDPAQLGWTSILYNKLDGTGW